MKDWKWKVLEQRRRRENECWRLNLRKIQENETWRITGWRCCIWNNDEDSSGYGSKLIADCYVVSLGTKQQKMSGNHDVGSGSEPLLRRVLRSRTRTRTLANRTKYFIIWTRSKPLVLTSCINYALATWKRNRNSFKFIDLFETLTRLWPFKPQLYGVFRTRTVRGPFYDRVMGLGAAVRCVVDFGYSLGHDFWSDDVKCVVLWRPTTSARTFHHDLNTRPHLRSHRNYKVSCRKLNFSCLTLRVKLWYWNWGLVRRRKGVDFCYC